MEERILTFSLIIEGTTEKALHFIMPLKSIYNKKIGFNEQKLFLRNLKQEKIFKMTHFLS